jgi:iron complex transport system permease protein
LRSALLADRRARVLGLVVTVALVAACAVASLAVGALDVPPVEVIRAFTAFDGSDAHVVVRELRLPRTELGLLVGAALGAAGAVMQGVTRNPLAEPGILGINAGAAFAVVVAINALGVASVAGYAAFALVGAGVASVLVYLLGGAGRRAATPVTLALAGAVLSALLVSLTSAVLVLDAPTLDRFRYWIVGSLAGRDGDVVLGVLPLIAVGLVICLVAGRSMNALALGDDAARALGQRVGLVRAGAAAGFVLCAGGAVAGAGPVAFVGLTVPHVARALAGPDYRWTIPYSALLGAALLPAADVAGRVIARPAEVEVGIVTAVLGAPFFIWLVTRRRLAHP